MTLLTIQNLSVDLTLSNGTLHAVRDVSFSLNRGESIGIVGESGSGKSMTALALMRLLPKTAESRATSILFDGEDVHGMARKTFLNSISGVKMSMIFQEPMTSLNPVYNVARQMTEAVLLRKQKNRRTALDQAVFLLEKVGIANAASRLNQYPHQLSGGQRQRVMIAMALMNQPKLIIADEPTTALDVTVQAQILQMLIELGKELGMAMILITHDLGVISRMVDKVAVMYAGQLVETGTTDQVFNRAVHPYTQGLLQCVPAIENKKNLLRLGTIPGIVPSMIGRQQGCSFANRCPFKQDICVVQAVPMTLLSDGRSHRCLLVKEIGEHIQLDSDSLSSVSVKDKSFDEPVVLSVKNATRVFYVRKTLFDPKKQLVAVNNVCLDLHRTEILALVGESGCGKTTLSMMMLGLEPCDSGNISLNETPLAQVGIKERARLIQPIFQDPYSSLNPRRTIGETILQPLKLHDLGDKSSHRQSVKEIMSLVGLPHRFYNLYPNQLSGGQRQRVAIARALIVKPEILVCDEPTSALDVSVQAQILNLLHDLRDELGLTYFIITHDLGVVNHMATRIAVMYLGQIVEVGSRKQIIQNARHPYTQALLDSVLSLQPGGGIPEINLGGGFPNPLDVPSGCLFHPRCPKAMDICTTQSPELSQTDDTQTRCLLFKTSSFEQ
ncbi:MAG: ABC transporter ATP-binding protein [Desulfobulbaceae bacterium]|nr:ABC transporter ATP-binding protein [Desulfobulbaceae bacterium]